MVRIARGWLRTWTTMASNQPSVCESWKKWSAIQTISRCQSREALLESCSRALMLASRKPGHRDSILLATSSGGRDPSSSAGRAQYAKASQSIYRATALARRSGSTNFTDDLAFRSLGTRWAVSSHCAAMPFHSSNDGYWIGLALFHFSVHSDQHTSARW